MGALDRLPLALRARAPVEGHRCGDSAPHPRVGMDDRRPEPPARAVLAAGRAVCGRGRGHLALARAPRFRRSVARGGGRGWSWTYALTQADIHVSEYLKNFVWPEAIRMAPQVVARTSLADPRSPRSGRDRRHADLAGKLRRPPPRRRSPSWILDAHASRVLGIPDQSSRRPLSGVSFELALVSGRMSGPVHALKPRLALALGTAVTIVLACASFSMNRIYRSENSLWAHSVRHGGEALAPMKYAVSLTDRTDPRPAPSGTGGRDESQLRPRAHQPRLAVHRHGGNGGRTHPTPLGHPNGAGLARGPLLALGGPRS